MMLAHLAGPMLQRELRTHLAAGTMNTGDVVIRWNAVAAPADANVEADYGAASYQTATVPALVFFVSAQSALSGWTQYAEGDAIVTFDPADLELTGKREVTFTLPDGKRYAQKDTDRDPVEFWSTFVGGERLTTTLLLRLVP